MPLYEYECDNCGNHFEKIQSVHDAPIRQCPQCASDRVRKIFSPAGIIFKGSGWYITDNRKSPPDTSSSSSSSSASSASGDTKSKSQGSSK